MTTTDTQTFIDELRTQLSNAPEGVDTAAIEAFGRGLRERLAMHATGAFAPRAGDHVIVTTGRFGGPGATRIEGRSLAEAFGDWYFERPGETVLIEAP